MNESTPLLPVAVLISGGGTTLRNLLQRSYDIGMTVSEYFSFDRQHLLRCPDRLLEFKSTAKVSRFLAVSISLFKLVLLLGRELDGTAALPAVGNHQPQPDSHWCATVRARTHDRIPVQPEIQRLSRVRAANGGG